IGIGRSEQIAGIDSTPPTITITAGATAVRQTGNTLITVRISEASPDIELADITVNPPSAGLLTALTLISPTGLTVTAPHPTEHVYTALFSSGTDLTRVTFTVAAGNFKDVAGHGNLATTANLFDVVDASRGSILLSISADKTEVTEGPDATVVFTITSPAAVTGPVVVPVTQSGEGDYLIAGDQGDKEITIPLGETMGHLTVTIDDDPLDELNGTLVYTIVSAPSGYFPNPFAQVVTVTVMDDDDPIPDITIDYAGQTSGGQACAASPAADKSGVCEGDAIVFTITATYAPDDALSAPRNDLEVRLGRLAAGRNANGHYGLTNPPNYVDYAGAVGPVTLTIPANQNTATMTINTTNGYGTLSVGAGATAGADGGYFVEILCLNGHPDNCLTDDARLYNFVHTGKGQAQGNRNPARNTTEPTSNCDDFAAAGSDGDDPSECLVLINPVAPPVLSIAANTDSVEQGRDAIFTITGDKVLTNHYNAERTALEALPFPISITAGQNGNSIVGATPTMVTMAADATTVNVSISSQAGEVGDGNITLMLDAGNRYTVGMPSIATVAITEPVTDTPGISSPASENVVVSIGTTAATPQETYLVSGTAEEGAMISIRVTDGTSTVTATVTSRGGWSTTVDISGLADGILDFIVTAKVDNKRVSKPQTRRVRKDLTPPTITSIAATTIPIGAPAIRIPSSATVDIIITASEPITGLDMADIAVSGSDEHELSNFRLPQSGDLSDPNTFIVTYKAGPGPYEAVFEVAADYMDAVRNRGTATTVTIMVAAVPTVRLSSADTTIDIDTATVITVEINVATTDFDAGDITIAPAGAGTFGEFALVPNTTNYTVTFTAGSNPTTATLSVAAGAFTDAASNDNTASNDLEITINTPIPIVSIANADDVAEGNDASFVITSDKAPSANLVITLAATNSAGTFLGASPPTMATIMATETEVTVTVPTVESRNGNGMIGDGIISVTLTDNSADYNLGSMTVGTATVKDIPRISIDYAGQASGDQMCEAAKTAEKRGICEGDAIVFTFTADATLTSPLTVRYGRLAAGVLNANTNYDIANAYDYIQTSAGGSPDRGQTTLTIRANADSVTDVINTVNEYGAQADGGYFAEVICHDNSNNGAYINCRGANYTATTPYTFNWTGTGNGRGDGTTKDPNTSNCEIAAGADGDDESECLVLIHSVGHFVGGEATPPTLSITAPDNNSSVEQGTPAVFTITASAAHNIYNADRTARIGLPISIEVSQTGDSIDGAAPTMATMGVDETTVDVTIRTQPGDTGTGTVSLEITSADGYPVGSPSAITVSVTEPEGSSMPTVDLAAASDTFADTVNGVTFGTNDDNNTSDTTPTITVGNVADAAMLTLVATHTDSTAVTVTATVAGT
ncbi:MAG: Ig-like domain-containing protein, partial [Pseudohongiellaceae bacterium]